MYRISNQREFVSQKCLKLGKTLQKKNIRMIVKLVISRWKVAAKDNQITLVQYVFKK